MNKDAGSVGLGQSRDEDKIKELEARPYQLELLEKAKVENIIVYLGTGSGKTFIAVMLIKHMRGALGVEEQGKILGGKKAIFLVSSVALVDQQAREVRNCTGLKVGSYCGADGVDDWTQDKWDNEFAKYQVLVFVHEVFKCILSSKYIRFSQLALIIMDECHHAVKSHPYSMIMSMYHMVKDEGRELMPKILGLTACVVVKSCDLDQFRQEKMKLEIKMDSKVRTTEDLLEILHYVTAPEESFVRFTTNSENEEVKSITEKTLEKVNMQYHNESQTIKDQIRSIQHRTIALRDLEKDFKMLKNEVIMDLGHLVDELGFYPLMKDIDKRLNELIKDKNKEKNVYYDHTVRSLMFETTVSFLESLQRICQTMSRKAGMTQLQKLNYFVSDKFNTLLQTIKKERSEDTETGLFLKNLSCIVFVERKSVAVAMANILADAALIDPDLSEMRVDYVHSDDNAFSTKNYRTDYEDRGRERKRLQDKLYLFRKQELNVLVSTKVVEEGLDVRSCNLVIKYDFPKEFRSYVQSKGRARKRPSKYIMMAANNGYKEETNHAKFRKVEKMSLEECHYLPEDMNVFDNEEEENETYMADETRPDISGTINGSQAIARINQYIQRIPVDRFTKLAPCWETLECSGSAQDLQNTADLYQQRPKAMVPQRNMDAFGQLFLCRLDGAGRSSFDPVLLGLLQDGLNVEVGRGPLLGIESTNISRKHVVIRRDEGRIMLKCLHRKGVRIAEADGEVEIVDQDKEVQVYSGDVIKFTADQYHYQLEAKPYKSSGGSSASDDSEEPVATGYSNNPSKSLKDGRSQCVYGAECFRKNPHHFMKESHPEDHDFMRTAVEENHRPECRYGVACYRKNPDHLSGFNHTLNTALKKQPKTFTPQVKPGLESPAQKKFEKDKLLCGLGLNSESGYRVRCHMPHKTPFWCPVEGPVRPSKLRAKRACALQVIRELYQLGEFTIRLKPKPRETKVADEDTDDEDEDSRGRKTGTRRKRHFYQSKLPRPLNLDPQGTGYLYKVCMVLENEVENARYAPYLPQEDPAHLGLVLAERTHNFGPLVLYGPSGPLSISVSFVKQIALTEEMLNCMKEFHQYAFTQVLKMERIEYKGSGLLLVPLTKGQIDLGVFRDRSQEPLDLDSVVSPKYKKSRVEHFFIEEWIRELNPTFKMNETNQTYLGYFSSKYGIQIQDETQPLLRISSANKKLFMFKPGGEAVKDKNSDNISQRTLLVPELMTQAMVPRGLWKQIQVIPFCLERMTSLLHASQLSYTLTGVTPHPDSCITIRDSWFNPQNVNPNLERLMRFHSGIPLKNVELLEALTLKNTDDLFDMERLEVLGDVFLKYRTSLFLYYTKISDCTKNKTNVNEGELTMLRSKVVGNKNLFRVARNLGLHTGPVNSAKIELSTWLPPGFTSTTEDRLIRLDSEFPDQISDPARRSTLSVGSMLNYINLEDLSLVDAQLINLAKKRFLDKEATGGIRTRENRLVSDKSLADVVEAIIGCFLIHTGQDNTLKVMARMGLDLIGGKDDLNAAKEDLLQSKIRQLTAVQEFEPEKDAFTNVQLRRDSPVSIYKSLGLEEIERKIGYVFNEKSFVLQAFTHSSYGDNYWTDSYERLEYLGDAVLDFLVSCYICTHSDADPGRMTDIRSALVCNNMFASLLVDKELHGNILYSASGVRKKITEYVESREEEFLDILNVNNNNNNLRIVERLQLINETEPPVLSEVEVPKVLGDVFEALMGAVFVDSGHDLRTVWRVYNNFKPCLAEIVAKPPKNPKKVLHDLFNDAKFGKVEVKENYVRISVSLTRNGKQYKFTGLGNNKKMAEVAASKCALRHLTRKGTA